MGMLRTQSRGVWIALGCLALAAWALGTLFSYVDKSFDLTDESYNVLLAMFPDHQVGHVTLTGFLTQFLWAWSDHSIPVFRALGIGLLLATALGMAACAATFAKAIGLKTDRSTIIYLFATAIGTVPFFYRELYVLSPGYNWLAMIGLLVVQSGFFLLVSSHSRMIAIAALGIGGLLAFAGKPTSGVAILALLSLVFLLLENRWRYLRATGLAVVVAVVVGIVFVSVLGGGLVETYERFRFGVEYSQTTQSNHSLGYSLTTLADALLVTPWKVFLFTQKFTILVIAAATLASWRLGWQSRYSIAAILVFSAIELSFHDISFGAYNFYLVSSFALSLISVTAAQAWARPERPFGKASQAVLASALLGLFIAVAYTFGTNTGPGLKMQFATVSIAVPLILAALWGEQKLGQRGAVAVVAFVSVVAGAVLLHRSAEDPSESESLAMQTEQATFLNQSDPIWLEPAKAGYTKAIIDAARTSGWESGTPLLNLAGHSTGTNIILDAPFVAVPALMGKLEIWPGGQDAAAFVASSMGPEQAATAWVLTSNGNRALDPAVLRHAGRRFPCQYERVARIASFDKAGLDGGQEIHELWRPRTTAGDCEGETLHEATRG